MCDSVIRKLFGINSIWGNMSVKLTHLDWTRLGVSVVLMGLSALCVLRAVIAGLAYSDVLDLPGRSPQAAELQHRAHEHMWICLLLQGLTTLLLAPALRTLTSKPDNSHPLTQLGNYALALVISIFRTGLAFPLLFWMLK